MNLPEDRPDARTTAADDGADESAAGTRSDDSDDDADNDTVGPARTANAAEPAAGSAGRARLPLVLMLAAVVVILDQLTKVIAVANLAENGESPRILGGLVYFSLLRNAGAAFSLATGMTWVLALVAVIVVVVIIRIASRLRSGWWATCLGLILGGAIGNLIDRFFRAPGFMQGHVVDFVSVFGPDAQYFPVFNVADSSITIGAVLLVLTSLRGIELDGTRARDRTAAVGESSTAGRATDTSAADTSTTDKPGEVKGTDA